MQYWKVDGELEHVSKVPSTDKYVRNLQWHCPGCGEIWARAVFIDLPQIKSKWDVISQHPCTSCGGGSLLDHYILSRLEPVPVPLEIYEREMLRELHLYNSGWPYRADPYYIGEGVL